MTETHFSFLRYIACGMLLVSVLLLSACSSSSSDPTPGADGDWEAADLVDTDSDNTADGDTDTGDSPADRDESDAELSDSDGDAEDAVEENEAEEDIEYPELPEQEEREAPELLPEDAFSTYSLLDRAELRSCDPEVTMDSPEFYWAVSVHRATDGILYFGNRYGLWRLEESPSEALVCVPGIEETVWSITSRRVGESHELWVGLDGRVGVLRDDTWEFIDVPQEWKHEDADYNGPLSSMVWKVEVNDQYEVIQTTQGVAFRRGSGGFQIIDWCPEGALVLPDDDTQWDGIIVVSSQWASILLSSSGIVVGGKQAIYAIDLTAQTCSQRCSTSLEDHYFVVNGENEAGLWAMHARPGPHVIKFEYLPSLDMLSEPYMQETEAGICDSSDSWHLRYQPPPIYSSPFEFGGYVIAGWTYVAGTISDRGLAGMLMSHVCDENYILFRTDSDDVEETEKFLLDHVTDTGWGPVANEFSTLVCFMGTRSIEKPWSRWSANMISDQGGYWYSPGFTRIEVKE